MKISTSHLVTILIILSLSLVIVNQNNELKPINRYDGECTGLNASLMGAQAQLKIVLRFYNANEPEKFSHQFIDLIRDGAAIHGDLRVINRVYGDQYQKAEEWLYAFCDKLHSYRSVEIEDFSPQFFLQYEEILGKNVQSDLEGTLIHITNALNDIV